MSTSIPTAKEIMTPAPYSIGHDQALTLARTKMEHHGIRHLPVLRGGEIVGVVSERDIALVESLGGVDLAVVPVREAMTSDPYTVDEHTSLDTVAEVLATRRIGTALVTDGRTLVGVITTTDLARELAIALRRHAG